MKINLKYLKFFIEKFSRGVLNFNGIDILLTFVEGDDLPVKLSIDNPNDLSYSKFAIEGFYYESFKEFYQSLGIIDNINNHILWKQLNSLTEYNIKEKYISRDLYTKLMLMAKKVKVMGFGLKSKNIGFSIHVDVTFVKLNSFYEENNIELKIVVLDIYDDFKDEKITDIKSGMDLILDMVHDGPGIPDWLESYFTPMLVAVFNEVTLVDENDGYVTCAAKFFSPHGDFLI